MKRTKKWWKQFNKAQRAYIVYFEKAGKESSDYGGGGYLPDDCSECAVCSQPMLGSGTCQSCYGTYNAIINKANN